MIYYYDEKEPVPNVPHRIRYTESGNYFAVYCGPWRLCKTGKGKYKPTKVIGKVIYSTDWFKRVLIPNEYFYEFMSKYHE